jgi:hypothetical protein
LPIDAVICVMAGELTSIDCAASCARAAGTTALSTLPRAATR